MSQTDGAGAEHPGAPPQPEGQPADPFAPPGVEFRPVSTGLITARLITAGLWLVVPLVATIVLAVILGGWFWLLPVVPVVLVVWLLWLIPRQVRAMGYAEQGDDLLIRKGILFRSLVVVPYGRMQFVDVNAGPLARRCGIAQVQLHTASAQSDAAIDGLPADEANRLRDRLTARGEARLAGL